MTTLTISDTHHGSGVMVATDHDEQLITEAVFDAFIEVIADGDLPDLQALMRLRREPCHRCGDRPSVGRDEYGAPRCETHEKLAAESGWAAA